MRKRTTLSLLSLFAVLTLLASACADNGDGNGAAAGEDGDGPLAGASFTVGSKDFDEQLVLGNISLLLLADAGADVTDRVDLGGTDAARAALTSGEIDHYWEYNGTAWISFFQETEPIADRVEQYEVVAERDLEENDLVWLTPSEFNNTYAIAYQSDIADELGNPQMLSDLGPILENNPEQATLCVETEFPARDDGLPGMEAAYGYEFPQDNVFVLDTGIVYTSTANQDPCNFGEVFITDGRVAELDLTVLEDDEGFFPLYNASPVFTSASYNDFSEALDELYAPVAEALTNDVMSELNRRVSAEGERPAAVAEDFLTSEGFIG